MNTPPSQPQRKPPKPVPSTMVAVCSPNLNSMLASTVSSFSPNCYSELSINRWWNWKQDQNNGNSTVTSTSWATPCQNTPARGPIGSMPETCAADIAWILSALKQKPKMKWSNKSSREVLTCSLHFIDFTCWCLQNIVEFTRPYLSVGVHQCELFSLFCSEFLPQKSF